MVEPLSTDMVLLPVDVRLVNQVHDYLTALREGRSPQDNEIASVDDEDSVFVTDQGRWTQSMVERLAEATPYEAVLALLDRCAQTPGRWIPKSEVEEAEGVSPIQLRNELGAFSKTTKRVFGGNTPIWPMEWKKERGAYLYRFDETVAQWWNLARRSA